MMEPNPVFKGTLVLDICSKGKKIREAQLEKVPYMLVVGDKEAESGQVAVRTRAGGDQGVMALDAFLAALKEEVDTKAIR